jgi:hypothetical protein
MMRQRWDVTEFSRRQHLPTVVGVHNKPFTYDAVRPIRVQDMPLRMPSQGWKIPPLIGLHFGVVLGKIMSHEQKMLPRYDDDENKEGGGFYVYITVDQKPVAPHSTQRRPGLHSDSYPLDPVQATKDGTYVDHIYLVSDELPTAFVPGPFSVDSLANPGDCEAVLQLFADEAGKQELVTYDPYSILFLTPYCIHRGVCNNTRRAIERTFVKIVITRNQYNREGNTLNPMFKYDWVMVPRDKATRNHPTAAPIGMDIADKTEMTDS